MSFLVVIRGDFDEPRAAVLQETTRGVVFRRSAARVSWECPDIDRAFYVQVRYPHGERWETVAVSAHRGMAASLAGGMYRDLRDDAESQLEAEQQRRSASRS